MNITVAPQCFDSDDGWHKGHPLLIHSSSLPKQLQQQDPTRNSPTNIQLTAEMVIKRNQYN